MRGKSPAPEGRRHQASGAGPTCDWVTWARGEALDPAGSGVAGAGSTRGQRMSRG